MAPPPGCPPLSPRGAEEDFVACDRAGPPQVWCRAHELVHVPFALLSLDPRARDEETVVVRFVSASHGAVVALLHLHLHPRPPVVHRTLRFHEGEGGLVKRTLRLAPGGGFLSAVEAGERRVLLESRDVTDGFGRVVTEVSFRYKLGAFPATGDFYVAVFRDKWRASLDELWHVVVASRLRKDLHAVLGQASALELVVRGDRQPRRVAAFASNELEVALSPPGPFYLAPGAFNQVALKWTPHGPVGPRTAHVHLVDVESRQLVAAWLLTAVASPPRVTKEFEVEVRVGEAGHKKVSYENPWPKAQSYRLRSSDPGRMRPKEERVVIEPRGRCFMRLFIAPQDHPGTSEFFLMVNDDSDQNDECFRIIVHTRR